MHRLSQLRRLGAGGRSCGDEEASILLLMEQRFAGDEQIQVLWRQESIYRKKERKKKYDFFSCVCVCVRKGENEYPYGCDVCIGWEGDSFSCTNGFMSVVNRYFELQILLVKSIRIRVCQ